MKYKSVEDVVIDCAAVFQPADRLTVTEAAKKYVVIKRPGMPTRHWDEDETPYMVEPQNLLSSRQLAAIIFCGPAQSGKTEGIILNFLAYSIMQDPMDMIIYNPTQVAARDFAVRRIDRMNLNSPEIRARLMKQKAFDNKTQKQYSSGMLVNLSWPTVTEMAGKPVGRIALTDYDRMDDKVGDEGSPFDLASMRTTTYKSFAMTVAESSPSRPIEDPRWMASSPHEAPPTLGILSLYNRGDRRRWYWPCPHCTGYFEGTWRNLKWDETQKNVLDAADTVYMVCPICGEKITPDKRPWMQSWGLWLKDGQRIDERGRIRGRAPRTKIASFWLNGVAAGMQTWQGLVAKYLNAEKEYTQTASEEALKQFYNNDLGEPYKPKSEELQRLPEVLQARAEPLPEYTVPQGVRFLVAAIDVQRSEFVVQVHGIGPGFPFDITIVDRFRITHSNRFDDNITPETPNGNRLWVKPGTYQEDWDAIIEDVMLKTYPVEGDENRVMTIKLTICDSGGYSTKKKGESVTTNAYEFYRKLKRKGLANRFHLVKGEPKPNAPRAFIDYPDSRKKDKFTAARGDVPVLFLNSNLLKDALSNRLDSTTPGKGMIRFPNWLEPWFYKELCAERRTDKGWENTQGVRNEAWDLLYYLIGACASTLLRVEQIDWREPPAWADVWTKNPLVVMQKDEPVLTPSKKRRYDFSDLGKALA